MKFKINNNFYLEYIGLFFVALLFISCNEDTIEISRVDEVTDFPTEFEVITYGTNNITGRGNGATIIAFSDQEAFDNLVILLENQVDTWDDIFVNQWDYLDDDALNDKEEELNFDSEKPLADFENQNGLNSLRQKYLLAEDVWLDNEELDDILDPENNPLFSYDIITMSLLNELGEIKIGDTIYKQLNFDEIQAINSINSINDQIEKGAIMEIKDGDFQTLIDFNSGDLTVVNNENVNVNSGNTQSDCKNYKIVRGSENYTSNKKVKLSIRYANYAVFYKVKAKVRSYKKRRGKWKRYRTSLGVALSTGYFCDGTAQLYTSSYKRKRRKRLSKRKTKFFSGSLKASRDGSSVVGRYEYAGNSVSLPLAW